MTNAPNAAQRCVSMCDFWNSIRENTAGRSRM